MTDPDRREWLRERIAKIKKRDDNHFRNRAGRQVYLFYR